MPGERLEGALGAAASLRGLGIGALLTRLGENVKDAAEASEVTSHYLDVLDQVRGLAAEISVKPTQLGLDLDRGRCEANLRALVETARATGNFVWIDMEQSRYTDATLDLCLAMRRLGPHVFGRHLRTTLRENTFISSEGVEFPNGWLIVNTIGIGVADGIGHLVDFRVEGNTFINGLSCVGLSDKHERTVVRNNTFSTRDGGEAILAVAGTHGILPAFPPDSEGSVIEGNTITGGFLGIAIFNGSGWTVRRNTVRGTVRAIWTEWGPRRFDAFGVIRVMTAERNLIEENDLRGNQVGVFVGASARDNIYRDNDVTSAGEAGYFLNGLEQFGPVEFPPASANTIIGSPGRSAAEIVVDATRCHGLNNCPQKDEDGDGRRNEDPIDGTNNDGDTLFGLSLEDEDPPVEPNVVIDIPVVVAAAAPAQTRDSDGDGLSDKVEQKLRATGFCADPRNPDTDGDGVSDGVELSAGTLELCR